MAKTECSKDSFPYEVAVHTSSVLIRIEMFDFCNQNFKDYEYDTRSITFNFAFDQHRTLFILKFSEYL